MLGKNRNCCCINISAKKLLTALISQDFHNFCGNLLFDTEKLVQNFNTVLLLLLIWSEVVIIKLSLLVSS